ncbi:MAG: phosphohydrolase, partial [Flavobacteriaceae bacterium]|nr:phosphohydrolase [Flavobacteriaceae bacterium]
MKKKHEYMSDTLDNLYRKQSSIYKYILYLLTVACIVFFFPKGGKFKYEFQKGKPWQYENLYAPFDFSILKSQEEIADEQERIAESQLGYYQFDESIKAAVFSNFEAQFDSIFSDPIYQDNLTP